MKKRITIAFISFSLISLLFASCANVQQSKAPLIQPTVYSTQTSLQENFEQDYGLLPNEIIGIGDSFKLVKGGGQNGQIVTLANSILEGYLFSNYLFTNNPKVAGESIDWDIQFSDSPSTYNLGLQTLDMIGILSNAYIQTKDISYLKKAYSILSSWINYSLSNPKSNYVWYDHSVSSRVLNIMYFLSTKSDNSSSREFFKNSVNESELIDVLRNHAKYLLNPSNYSYNNNHGIMADRALISLAFFLPHDPESDVWLETGLARMQAQFSALFEKDGSYAENSPGYAQGALSWFVEMQDFLEPRGHSLITGNFNELITPSFQFLFDLTMPNDHFPMWGDTLDALVNYNRGQFNPEKKALSVYPNGGYAIISDKDLWLGIKSGYVGGMAHKHEDDLSFVLFALGKDIFLDPGMYNYEKTDPYRKYFVSANAHNTIIVDDQSFSTSLINDSRSGIVSWKDDGDLQEITVFNNLYASSSIQRTIYYIKPGIIILFDNIQSLESHKYSQLFQLNEDIIVDEIDQQHVELSWDSGQKTVNVYQLFGAPTLVIHKGSKKIPGYGLLSRNINEVTETSTLEFIQRGEQAFFMTLIDLTGTVSATISNSSSTSYIVNIINNSTQQQNSILLDTAPREITPYLNYSSDCKLENIPVTINKSQSAFDTFSYQIEPKDDPKNHYVYNWYIWKEGKIIEKYNWSDKNLLQLNNLAPGIYEIQAYLRNTATDARYTGIIDKIYVEAPD